MRKILLTLTILLSLVCTACSSNATNFISEDNITTETNTNKTETISPIPKKEYSENKAPSDAEIKRWIENRYDYYDKKDGEYTGDKYTNKILEECATKFDMTVSDVKKAWDNAIFGK